LTERNPSAWLPFGTGSRKCIAQKLAMSKIKLVIVRLLQNYVLDKAKSQNEFKKITELIQTKDILFNAPIGGVYVSIDRKNLIARDK
jgi:cytochrome P450